MKISQPVIACGAAPAGLANGAYAPSVGATLQKQGAGIWDLTLDRAVPDGTLVVVATLSGRAGQSADEDAVFVEVGYYTSPSQGIGCQITTYTSAAGTPTEVDAPISYIATFMPDVT